MRHSASFMQPGPWSSAKENIFHQIVEIWIQYYIMISNENIIAITFNLPY